MSHLKANILANYFSQIYVTLVGILLLPMYIKYMGSEAYGLIGFFAMLQAWFGVLDLGLTPTIGRETARYKGGAITALAFRQLYRALMVIFIIVAFVAGSVLFSLSNFIATKWLNLEVLPVGDVVIAVQIMAISVALRWMCGLFRGVVSGSEQLVWLSCFNAFIATLRFVGVFLSMWYFGFTPLVFFIHQFFVAVTEIVILAIKAQKLLPNKKNLRRDIGWSFEPIKPVLKFSLTIAFTAAIWVIVTQTDKLILSGILSLEDYGNFTLAVLVANGIMMVSGPISSAIMPRMARLHAENQREEMIALYRKSTQLVAILAGSAAITLIIASKPLLIAWTGDVQLALKAGPILSLYAAGNLFLCMAAFSYYLQYAKGSLRYHLIGNIGLVVVLIPAVIFAAINLGAVGAGFIWLIMNFSFFFFWVTFVHYKLEPSLHFKWLLNDTLKIVMPSFTAGLLFFYFFSNSIGTDRFMNVIFVIVTGIVVITVSLFSSDRIISTFKRRLR